MPRRKPGAELRKTGELQRCIESQILADALTALLRENQMSAYGLAADLNIAHSQVYGVLQGDRNMTPVLALKLGRYFDHDPMQWMALQCRVDLSNAMRAYGDAINAIVPIKDKERTE